MASVSRFYVFHAPDGTLHASDGVPVEPLCGYEGPRDRGLRPLYDTDRYEDLHSECARQVHNRLRGE